MKKLDNDQTKIIRACNKYRESIRFLGKTTACLLILSIIYELKVYKHYVDINILNRKIEELEKRLDEYTYGSKEV
jgi:hypothetical protein